MKIQTGNPVRGDDFFKRENVIDQAWDHLDERISFIAAIFLTTYATMW